MTQASASESGLEIAFADGYRGVIPWSAIPEVGAFSNLANVELPNPYEIVLHTRRGETVELPWDFARNFCEPSYRALAEAVAQTGRQAVGERIRRLRQESKTSQAQLAAAAGIGRVTLVRIEHGEQSPRYETLLSLASALGRKPAELIQP